MRSVTCVFAVALLKGGVGKTTTAVGLGLSLGREPKLGPVLLVDADPQASATASRATLVGRYNQALDRLVADRGEPPGTYPAATMDNIYPFSHCQLRFPPGGELTREATLSQLEAITEGRYTPTQVQLPSWASTPTAPQTQPPMPSVVVVDTSPAYPDILSGVLDFMAKQTRPLVIVPTTMSDFDIPQARQFPEILRRYPSGEIPFAILATKFDRRRKSDGERLELLREQYPVFNTVVPYGVSFARGPFDDYDRPKSDFGRVYKSVTAEAMGMLVGTWQQGVELADPVAEEVGSG